MSGKSFPAIGCKSETEGFARLFGDSAILEILANRRGGSALKLIFPPLKCPLVELNHEIAVVSARLKTIIINQRRQRHTRLFRDELDGFGKADALHLHDEVEDGAALVTAEAEKHLLRRIDVE